VQDAFGLQLGQPRPGQEGPQAGTERRVDPGRAQQLDERPGAGLPRLARRFRQRDRAEVAVLDHEPAARPQGGGQLGDERATPGQLLQQQPDVDEVVADRAGRAAGGVVAHLGPGGIRQPGVVDLRGDDVTRRTDPGDEPIGHRGGGGADGQAAPARPDADVLEVPNGQPVPGPPDGLPPGGVIEVVGARGHHVTVSSVIIPLRWWSTPSGDGTSHTRT
jgi:hypothetical protein